MAKDDSRHALARALDTKARGVSAATLDAEMGAMCRESFFQRLHDGSAVDPQAVDDASQAFTALTETVVEFVAAEALRRPPAPALAQSLAFIERWAISEETGIHTFGQEWSRMKIEP